MADHLLQFLGCVMKSVRSKSSQESYDEYNTMYPESHVSLHSHHHNPCKVIFDVDTTIDPHTHTKHLRGVHTGPDLVLVAGA